MRTKTWSYATGAFFGGVAGAFYASYKSGAFPDDFFFQISVFILGMVILGGMGNIWGVIFGACFLSYLDREGLSNVGTWMNTHLGTHVNVPLYEFGIYGAIIVIVMLFRPEGLIPSSRRGPSSTRACTTSRSTTSSTTSGLYTPGPELMAEALLETRVCARSSAASWPSTTWTSSSPSGSIVSPDRAERRGKTTFFNMLTGVYKPTAGR